MRALNLPQWLRSRPLMSTLLATLALAVAVSGCKRPASQTIVLTKDQEQQIADNILNAPPAMQQKLDVKFEDKLTLLGYDLKGTPAKKGGAVDLTMYFRVDEPVHGDWKIFVHFEAAGKRRQPFDHYGIGGLYPVGSWKKGEIIKDTVNIQIPGDWPSDVQSQILVGVFDWGAWSKAGQDRRLKIVSAGAAKSLPDDRIVLTTFDVGGGAAAGGAALERAPRGDEPAAVYAALQTATAPIIDGKIDDAVWASAAALGRFRQPDGQPLSAALSTSAKLAWDKDNLYFSATTRDGDIRNDHAANDATLWEGDVIELFLALPGKDGQYVELQFAPNGARFDAHFTGHRSPEWPEAAKFESGLKHAVQVSGSVNGDGEADTSWQVEASIPWKGLGLEGAPAAGTKLAANVYRIDNKGPHDLKFMGTWAPVGNDFHQLQGAGTITLAAAPAAP